VEPSIAQRAHSPETSSGLGRQGVGRARSMGQAQRAVDPSETSSGLGRLRVGLGRARRGTSEDPWLGGGESEEGI
jgi:hypothetical protein